MPIRLLRISVLHVLPTWLSWVQLPPYLGIPFEEIVDAVKEIFGRKGEDIVNTNIACLRAGKEFAEKL